ncbi:FmdB family zinc ribbon protein [Nannocystis punicea]|uniref:Zinc ribbon domain-containing protein n=1 Tax=Nannocystis punicea TaxID=2995304 RepID=A0ABY7HGV7_9BACT|nr:FmdB family zinc ribbon protein [Nannocystis poenicansa]WAS98527.1 zinc ribbon domain-containing protein [Nannocystis poenicansa]
MHPTFPPEPTVMPIYAYRCLQCEAEPEFIQKMSDDPITVCEACGGQLVRKVTAASFHLKGGGWYKDGYASTKPGDGGDKSKSESSSTPASDSTASKSESTASKPAESSSAKAATS